MYTWKKDVNTFPSAIYHESFIPFDKVFLCEIYFGLSTSQKDIDEIEEILASKGNKPEKKCRMKMKSHSFELFESLL